MGNQTNIWNIHHNSIKKCLICSKEFKVKWSHLARRKCCSIECRHKLQKILLQGEKNPKWRGGKRNSCGYITIRVGNEYIYEHILIWRMNRGDIPEGFIIHHINGKRDDNRIENLQCMSQSDHMKLHRAEN